MSRARDAPARSRGGGGHAGDRRAAHRRFRVWPSAASQRPLALVRSVTMKRPELASTLPIRDNRGAPEGSIPPTVTSSARYPPDREGTRCHWSIASVVVRFVRVDGRDLGPLDAARTTSSGRTPYERAPVALVGHHRWSGRDHPGRPVPRRPQAARGDCPRGHPVGAVLRRPGRRLRDRAVAVRGRCGGRGVLRRVHHRVLAVGRQPVRVRPHHGRVPGARGAPAPGAPRRHRHRPGDARCVHRGRCGRHPSVQLGVLPVRSRADRDGGQRGPAGHRPRRGVLGERAPAADASGRRR